MSENLNQNLYSRFGLQLDLRIIQNGCKKYFKKLTINILGPIIAPDPYEDSAKLWNIQSAVLGEVCRQLFLDMDDWYNTEYSSGLKRLVEREISDDFSGSFTEYLLRLQILFNVVAKYGFIRDELDQLAGEVEKYLSDFPILGVTIKLYKRKAPQILPTISEKFEGEIKNTLGLLEADKKYEHALSSFENGLKEFLLVKTQAQYKDVIEDMYAACDELVKVILNNKNKGFKHIQDKKESQKLGLNGHQKELYKNLRLWMDNIKHGSLKNFGRIDTEMIISMVGSLIRFVILKYEQKS